MFSTAIVGISCHAVPLLGGMWAAYWPKDLGFRITIRIRIGTPWKGGVYAHEAGSEYCGYNM
jgi:hypothetical protein